MKFYVLASQRAEVEKTLNKMVKHLTNKPTITFGEVESKVKRERVDLKGEDGVTTHEYKYIVDVISVSIEDLAVREWRLVASVFFYENLVTMGDSELFKQMPKCFGLEYKKCDFCGSTRSNRKESHVLFNTLTGEWVQVGSECVNKVIDGAKKLSKFVCDLYEYFLVKCGGCEWGGFGGWSAPDHSRQEAVQIDYAVSLCRFYRENHSKEWKKSEWDDVNRVRIGGTNDALIGWHERATLGLPEARFDVDMDLYQKVAAYVDGLKGGYDTDWYGQSEPNFNQRIKDAFAAEYIRIGDIYLAYFALKGYEDSLTSGDFEAALKANDIAKGIKYTFEGTLLKIDEVEGYDDWTGRERIFYEAVFIDSKSGLKFVKEISYPAIINPYKQEDGSYRFNCNIKYIAYKKRLVGLGGRLSKAK